MDKVFIRKFSKTNYKKEIKKILFDGFDLEKKLKKSKIVVIKPNLVTDVKSYIRNGSNTDLRIIESILFILKDFKKIKTYIVESDTGTKIKGRKLELALKEMGVLKLQKKYSFEVLNLTHDNKQKVKIHGAKILKTIQMSKTLMSADLIINLPKMKTHKYSVITCALKNLFGIIPDPLRVVYHRNIHQVLSDLNRLFYKKMIVVTDGVICMEGQGPIYGKAKKLGVLIFADNPLLNDVVAAKIMKIDLKKIKHLNLTNLWMKKNFAKIEIDSYKEIDKISKSFILSHKNIFVRIEEQLMRNPFIVRILFNDWFRKNISKRLNFILKRLRGGSYSWYE